MSGPLAGQRVLVTGASRGIGRPSSLRVGSGRRRSRRAREPKALPPCLGARTGSHAAVALDVRTGRRGEMPGRHCAERDLSGVVTAAATLTPIGPIGSWDVEEFRNTLDVNVVGTLLAIESTLDPPSSHGSVVAFSGGGATGAFPRYDAYAASKAAVVRLTENLAVELVPTGSG